MEDIEHLFTKEEFSSLSNTNLNRGVKTKIRNFILTSPEKIKECLIHCKTIEHQIVIINTIIKGITREEIMNSNLLGEYSLELSQLTKNCKNRHLGLLVNFNSKENSRVTGAFIDRVQLPSKKEMTNGFIFIGEGSFRIQERNEVVVIFFKSVINLKMEGMNLDIEATEGRLIRVKLKYNQDLEKFKNQIAKNFYGLEAQTSIVLDIGKRVSFESREEKEILSSKENMFQQSHKTNEYQKTKVLVEKACEDSRNIDVEIQNKSIKAFTSEENVRNIHNSIESDYSEKMLHVKGTSNEPNKIDLDYRADSQVDVRTPESVFKNEKAFNSIDRTAKTLENKRSILRKKFQKKNDSPSLKYSTAQCNDQSLIFLSVSGSSVSQEELFSCKHSPSSNKNKRKRRIKRVKNFKANGNFREVSIFKGLESEIKEIYSKKLLLAKLKYENMKNQALKFKKKLESLKNRKIFVLDISHIPYI